MDEYRQLEDPIQVPAWMEFRRMRYHRLAKDQSTAQTAER